MRIRSLALFLAQSSMIPAIAVVGLLAMGAASASDPVYHWKDANGQSQYSQQPPEKGIKYETIAGSGAPTSSPAAPAHSETAPAQKPTTAAPPSNGPTQAQNERQKLCDTARKNVDVLTNRPLVEMDINNTGTPVRLTPEQQTQQLDVAQKQQNAYCGK